mmetsp:Transcript_77868/g.167017  ORF Transcript_77868/g.167017 Transcript_77868/m.167017 type:complete len:297 (+) Transcript_77868:113-1003(+)
MRIGALSFVLAHLHIGTSVEVRQATRRSSRLGVQPDFFEETLVDESAIASSTVSATVSSPDSSRASVLAPSLVAVLQKASSSSFKAKPDDVPVAVLQKAAASVSKVNKTDAVSAAGPAPKLGQGPQDVQAPATVQGPLLLAARADGKASAQDNAMGTVRQLFSLVSTGARAVAENAKPDWWKKVTSFSEAAPSQSKLSAKGNSEVDEMQPGAMSFFRNVRVDKDGAKSGVAKKSKAQAAMIAVKTAPAASHAWPSEEEQRRLWQQSEKLRLAEAREAVELERQARLEEKMNNMRLR